MHHAYLATTRGPPCGGGLVDEQFRGSRTLIYALRRNTPQIGGPMRRLLL